MIVVDTSSLIDALCGPQRSLEKMIGLVESGDRLVIPALVMYEWIRGPRHRDEIAAQEELFPSDQAAPFGPEEARVAADLYRKITKPRGREIDIAIAATAIVRDASLWTLNREDFRDIPGLRLI